MQHRLDPGALVHHPPVERTGRPSLLNEQTLWVLLFVGAVAWSLRQAGLFDRPIVNGGGWALVWDFLRAALHPELSADFLRLTLDSTITTLAYAVCGTVLSLALGLVGGVVSSEVWWDALRPRGGARARTARPLPGISRTPWLAIRGLLAIPRAIHEIIWALFFVNILGLDPLVAILAIAIPFGAITAKVFAEIFDETPRAPFESLLNSGASPLSAFTYGLVPEAFPNLLSYTFYRFECSIRSAAVLGLIGAGGLGYQLLLSFQSLRYEQMWTLFVALILLNGIVDLWSGLLRRRLGAATRIELNTGRLSRPRPIPGWDRTVKASALAAALLLIFSFWYVKADFTSLASPRTAALFGEVLAEALPPTVTGVGFDRLLTLSLQTLALSILAIAIAGIGGIVLSYPAANNFLAPGGILDVPGNPAAERIRGSVVLAATRLLLLMLRSIPAPVWALILLFVLFPGILPGAVALGVYNLGILGRLMAEVTENLDRRPLQALKAQGASGPQVLLYGVFPRTLPGCVAYVLYRWEVCTRETVLLGLVGTAGLGRLLTEQLSSFDYSGVTATLICFVALTFLVDLISSAARRALR